MRRARRGAGLGALLLTVLGAAGLAAPGAEAAPGRCAAGTGVTVVVDYGALGRSTGIGCDAGGGGDTAARIVPAAGFPITYTAGQPFVCRIDGLPDASQEACQQTPPADAYWGLFWNDGRGGGWVYSSQGVASLRVPEGGSIGWRWQDGGDRDLPREGPNPPAPKPTPTKPPSNGGGGAGAGGSSTPTPSATPAQTSPSAAPSESASPKAKKKTDAGKKKAQEQKKAKKKGKEKKDEDEPSESPSPTAAASATGGEEVTATQPTSAPSGDDGTGTVVLLAGAGAVVLLGAAAGILAWRRRA